MTLRSVEPVKNRGERNGSCCLAVQAAKNGQVILKGTAAIFMVCAGRLRSGQFERMDCKLAEGGGRTISPMNHHLGCRHSCEATWMAS